MGRYHVNKCILLDEQELDGAPATRIEELEAIVHEHCGGRPKAAKMRAVD